jgi:hypothetical protein
MALAYPLDWPPGWQRTHPYRRARARYTVSQGQAQTELLQELRKMDEGNIGRAVISTNLPIRKDGYPYARRPQIDDPGVAVYFMREGDQYAIACDRWDLIKDNIRAIGLSIAALNQLDRCGASRIIDRAYRGFQALPTGAADWRNVLGLGHGSAVGLEDARAAYRRLAMAHHPDRGGDPVEFQRINEARRHCQRELEESQ